MANSVFVLTSSRPATWTAWHGRSWHRARCRPSLLPYLVFPPVLAPASSLLFVVWERQGLESLTGGLLDCRPAPWHQSCWREAVVDTSGGGGEGPKEMVGFVVGPPSPKVQHSASLAGSRGRHRLDRLSRDRTGSTFWN